MPTDSPRAASDAKRAPAPRGLLRVPPLLSLWPFYCPPHDDRRNQQRGDDEGPSPPPSWPCALAAPTERLRVLTSTSAGRRWDSWPSPAQARSRRERPRRSSSVLSLPLTRPLPHPWKCTEENDVDQHRQQQDPVRPRGCCRPAGDQRRQETWLPAASRAQAYDQHPPRMGLGANVGTTSRARCAALEAAQEAALATSNHATLEPKWLRSSGKFKTRKTTRQSAPERGSRGARTSRSARTQDDDPHRAPPGGKAQTPESIILCRLRPNLTFTTHTHTHTRWDCFTPSASITQWHPRDADSRARPALCAK